MNRLSEDDLDEIKALLLSYIRCYNVLDKDCMSQPCAVSPPQELLYRAVDAISALRFDLIEERNGKGSQSFTI